MLLRGGCMRGADSLALRACARAQQSRTAPSAGARGDGRHLRGTIGEQDRPVGDVGKIKT